MRLQKWMSLSAAVCGVMLVLSVPVPVAAQDGTTTGTARSERGQRGRGFGVFRVAQELSGLTTEQKEKITKLQETYRAKMEEARSKAGSGDAATTGTAGGSGRGSWGGPEMQKLMTEARTEVEAILNEEQKKELGTKLEEQRARWGRREGTSGTPKQ